MSLTTSFTRFSSATSNFSFLFFFFFFLDKKKKKKGKSQGLPSVGAPSNLKYPGCSL